MSSPSKTSSKRAAGPVSSELLSDVFGAISHPVRRQVLIILYARGGMMSAGEIADRFKHSWPTTTRHLGVLENAGVVEVQKQGRSRVYRLQTDVLLRAADWIYSWAALPDVESDSQWKELPYASMRNAIAPDADGENSPTESD